MACWHKALALHILIALDRCCRVQTVPEEEREKSWSCEEEVYLSCTIAMQRFRKGYLDLSYDSVGHRLHRCVLPPTVRRITSMAELPDPGLSPFETLIHAEAEDFFWGFYEFLADEPLLQNVIECIDASLNKPADIAVHLGVPPKEMYNVRKRLQRRLNDYRAQRVQKSFPEKGGKTNG